MLILLMGSMQTFSMNQPPQQKQHHVTITEAETEKLIESYQKQHPQEFPELERTLPSNPSADKRRAMLIESRKVDALGKLIDQYRAQGDSTMVKALEEKKELYRNRFKTIKDSRLMP